MVLDSCDSSTALPVTLVVVVEISWANYGEAIKNRLIKIDQKGRHNDFIWSCLQSFNNTTFLDDSAGKARPYNHWVKDKI